MCDTWQGHEVTRVARVKDRMDPKFARNLMCVQRGGRRWLGAGHVAAAAGWNIEINYRYGLRGHWWKLCWLKANFYRTLYLSSIIIPQFHRRFRRDEDTMYPYYFIIWHTVNSLNTRLKIYICPIVRKCRKGEVDILKYLHLMAETQSPGAGTLAWWWIPTATTSRADAVLTRRKCVANTADACQEVNSHY